jgi:retron-type reverse transcriptase
MFEKEGDGVKVGEGSQCVGEPFESRTEKELLERILSPDNIDAAYKQVKRNKGSHGVDGMTVDQLLPYLFEHGKELRESILRGTYNPKPVRRVEIPKPDGGVRLLGIPTVVDRVVLHDTSVAKRHETVPHKSRV